MSTPEATKYLLYARKSDESDEKQVQSIENQEAVMRQIAALRGISIVDVLSEAKSAKAPYQRKEFESLIARIKRGDASGILVWKIDRLCRNPVDAGIVQWLLQNGVISKIVTSDRDYNPEDNALILSVESGMATQYVRDLAKNVKRGMLAKAKKGWKPSVAVNGYLNTKHENRGENYILKDPERFDLLKRAFELIISRRVTAMEALSLLNNEWGYRTRKTKRRGGQPLSKSSFYQILTNPFYAGLFHYNGETHIGKHPPMISLADFEELQRILRRKGNSRYKRHPYSYLGGVHCGVCNHPLTVTYKTKFNHELQTDKGYYLYYCLNGRRKKKGCTQSKYTNEDVITAAVNVEIGKIAIDERIRDWGMQAVRELKSNEPDQSALIAQSLEKEKVSLIKQLDTLTRLRINGMIDDEEFAMQRSRLKDQQMKLELSMSQASVTQADWGSITEKAFEFAYHAKKDMATEDPKKRLAVLSALSCLNCTIVDQKVSIIKVNWLIPFEQHVPLIRHKIELLEPAKNPSVVSYLSIFDMIRPELCAIVDAIRTAMTASDSSRLAIVKHRRV